MYKKIALIIWIFTSLVLFLSCKRSGNSNSFKNLENKIDYKKIDLYPVLPECSKIKAKLQKACFYQAISKRIHQNISTKNIQLNSKIKDSISVSFIIDTIGIATISSIEHHYNYNNSKVLDSIITISFKKLPKMKPAIKMGIPVKAKFTIPIIISTKSDL